MNFKNKHALLLAVLLAIVCVLLYLPALNCEFVNLDDPEYVIDNTGIRSIDREFFHFAFLSVPLNVWLPLLLTSFAIDYHFWGLNPFGYHLTNILLHAVNAGLVVLLADALYRKRFARDVPAATNYLYPCLLLLAGLLFGVHPARVESVVWISERKDVLNGIFTLASIYFYLGYQERRDNSGVLPWRSYHYGASLVLFLLSMMAKPSSVLLPAALLVMDWYPLERLRKGRVVAALMEKVPYFLGALPLVAISLIARAGQGGFNSTADFPLAVRTVAAGNSLVEYFKLMVFPVGILPYHTLPRAIPDVFIHKAFAVVLFLCACLVLAKKVPWFTACILFFTITILPSLHFVADGYQLLLASRYTYLPSILPAVLLAAVIVQWLHRASASPLPYARPLLGCLVVCGLVFYMVQTRQLIGPWQNSGVLWSKVIAHEPFDKAYFLRGEYYASKGAYAAAIDDYTTCLSQASVMTIPALHNVFAFRGDAFAQSALYQQAVDDFTEAILMYPHPLYFYHRGRALQNLGRTGEADANFANAGQASGQLMWFE